ncbi:hypothetical protein GCM10010387_67560 [Streptomyces inusitatus]|uniref:Uncharacterized protein n=1 Tax=Streptomyces inusitatus TaxID=68221 RepID=A0A918V3W9_9ACTN|nr:hypothetical protein [Streptomyces inusitatus]GGZ64961.1 hypothetical protein GCM10010387_67560 [Streptomyces inusitatus]
MDDTEVRVQYDVADEYAERTQEAVAPVAVAVVAAEPLRIVQHPPRQFTTGAVTVTAGQVQQLAGAAPFRDSLHIVNGGGGPVYLGPDRDTLTPMGGFWLGPGQKMTMRSRHAVYVLGDASLTAATPVHTFAEYVDG